MKKRIVGLLAGIVFIGGVNSASANMLVNGDFDTTDSTPGLVNLTALDNLLGGWDVYETIPGWMRGDNTAGIEIQNNTVVPAHSGAYYVELDSDGEDLTNSSMFQTVDFAASGSYELSFMYRPRTNTSDDNGIDVFFDGGLLGSASDVSSVITDWKKFSFIFSVGAPGSYDIAFAATGLDNTLGGFIDSAQLNPVPEPATMLLFGAGLAGLAGFRQRRKK